MITAPQNPPDIGENAMELARSARHRRRMRRRRENLRFAAAVLLVAGVPALLPSSFFPMNSKRIPTPDKPPISVEEPAYGNTPAERPEGLSTVRIRRIR